MPESQCLLFLHIPKTAGTSFRRGAIETLGAEYCHFDYGADSPETSDLVRQHVYAEPDLYKLGAGLKSSGARLFGGHFGYRKYSPLFRIDRVFAFCRHPRQQLMSHYSHLVRDNGYEGSLREFLDGYAGAGMQTRVFGNVPLEAIGFVGVTERYAESLRVFRELYGIEIESMTHNVNPNKAGDSFYSVPEDMVLTYEKAVDQDMSVYCRANAMLDARLALLDAGQPYVHGAIQAGNASLVRGFAFGSDDEPVTIELEVNGRPVASKKAIGEHPGLRSVGCAPRNGYVGYEFRPSGRLKPGDHVVVKVASSGQVLGSCTISAPKESVLT